MDVVEEIDFCQMVEEVARDCDSYIDAVIKTCTICNVDIRTGAKLLSRPIIEKIQREGEDINLLPRMSKLPV